MKSTILIFTTLIMITGCGASTQKTGEVTVKGSPLTTTGHTAKVGDKAPDFTALDNNFKPVSLSDFGGRPVLISAAPSLDTPVCSQQTQRFNEEVANLPEDVVIIAITMDLPFAQKRFCATEGVDRITVLSDSARREFGEHYGIFIPERGLLARSIFVIDRDGTLIYKEIVPELTNHPDYDTALAMVKGVE